MLCVHKMIQNVLCTYASGRFLPTPCRLKAPRAASAITQLTDGRSRQFRVESPSWPLSRWGIPTTWSWPGTGPKTSRRNLLGKPVNLQKNTCEKTHLFWVMWVSEGVKVRHAFWLIYLVIFARNIDTYILHVFFSEVEYLQKVRMVLFLFDILVCSYPVLM